MRAYSLSQRLKNQRMILPASYAVEQTPLDDDDDVYLIKLK
jgi:hypothetical protein